MADGSTEAWRVCLTSPGRREHRTGPSGAPCREEGKGKRKQEKEEADVPCANVVALLMFGQGHVTAWA